MAAKTPVSKDSPHVQKRPNDDDEFLKKRKECAEKAMNLQRSHSMDALDKIGKPNDHDDPLPPRRKTSREGHTHISHIMDYPSLVPRKHQLYSEEDARESMRQFRREHPSTSPWQIILKSVESLVDVLRTGIEVNTLDIETGDAPIHAIIKSKKTDRLEFLLALLVNSNADVNRANRREMAPLHLAVEEGDEMCVKALVVFGANINQQGCNQFTPLDLAIDNGKVPDIEEVLFTHGAKSSAHLMAKFNKKVPRLHSFALYNKTLRQSKHSSAASFNPEGGSRLLFMDGGGIKGLAEIEVLMQLEERTKCKITDLFDWIIGSSTGAIIALAMVYGKKSLKELRQLFFLLKNRIFSKARYGFGYNTENLEEILKEYLDPSLKMSDVTHPKVLIAAVNKATTNLKLKFFNNCFGDDIDYEVWKVARYTSAAPMFFHECDNYVDGGVLCNNPTEYGLTVIQNFYRRQGKKFQIALVVSIGSGKYPAEKLGSVNAQDFLSFGKQWLNPPQLMKRTLNLYTLLSNAIVESEMVAENSRSRCEEQHIPFYRFSATLDDIVEAGETDNDKLFNMVLKTKMETPEQGLDSLVEMLAEISKRIVDSIEEEGDLQNESPSAPQEHVHVSPEAMFAIGEVVDVHETKAEGVKEGYQPLETEDQDSQQT